MEVKEGEIIFSAGKKVFINDSIVGISLSDNRIHHGYDGVVLEEGDGYYSNGIDLTKAEAAELCNHMIDVWKKKLASLGTED